MFIQSLSSCTKEDPWPNTYYGSLLLDGKEMREKKRIWMLYVGDRFKYMIFNHDDAFTFTYSPLDYRVPFIYEDGSGQFWFSIQSVMNISDFECEKKITFTVSSEDPHKDYIEAYRQLMAGDYVEPSVLITVYKGPSYYSYADSGYIIFKEGWDLEGEPEQTSCAGIEFAFDFEFNGSIHHVTEGYAIPIPGHSTFIW